MAIKKDSQHKQNDTTKNYEPISSQKICSTYQARKHKTTPSEISLHSNISKSNITFDLTNETTNHRVSPWKLEFATQCIEMKHWYSHSEVPMDMKTKPEYELIICSRLQSISTAANNLASIRFWKHYTSNIEGQIEELAGDSGNDLAVE